MSRPRARPLTLFAVLLAAVLLAGGLLAWHALAPAAPPRARVAVEIGGAHLLVPTALIRSPAKRVDGAAAKLDLALRWPDFEPLAERAPDAAVPTAIFLTLEAADATLDPAQRPRDLYARFLAPEVETGPGALLRRLFKATSPYGGEYLAIAPPDGEIFAARCLAGQSVESPSGRCLWLFRHRDLDVQVRFAPDVLPEWERLNDHVRQLVQRIYLEQ